jgi:hypothetical protein
MAADWAGLQAPTPTTVAAAGWASLQAMAMAMAMAGWAGLPVMLAGPDPEGASTARRQSWQQLSAR